MVGRLRDGSLARCGELEIGVRGSVIKRLRNERPVRRSKPAGVGLWDCLVGRLSDESLERGGKSGVGVWGCVVGRSLDIAL